MTVLLLVLLVLLFGMGGSGYGWRAGWGNASVGPLGLALLVVFLLWAFGVLH